jgi:plasmid stabilization system protein ParE
MTTYYTIRNGNSKYIKHIEREIKSRLKLIAHYPRMYQETSRLGVRAFSCDYFKIFYRIYTDYILVEAIFDTRQDPDKSPFTDESHY